MALRFFVLRKNFRFHCAARVSGLRFRLTNVEIVFKHENSKPEPAPKSKKIKTAYQLYSR